MKKKYINPIVIFEAIEDNCKCNISNLEKDSHRPPPDPRPLPWWNPWHAKEDIIKNEFNIDDNYEN